MKDQPRYHIHPTLRPAELRGDWDGEVWRQAEILAISQFRPESSAHRPETAVKLLYDDAGLYVIFRVRYKYIRCVHANYSDPVYLDSCVEWFVQPRAEHGYFNIETNCGGAILCSYIEDPTRNEDGRLRRFQTVPFELARRIAIFHSLPAVVDPEIVESREWRIEYFVPFSVFEHFVGTIRPVSGQTWHANFYKCGNDTSHPHWVSWSPIRARDFHRPQEFAPITFIGAR